MLGGQRAMDATAQPHTHTERAAREGGEERGGTRGDAPGKLKNDGQAQKTTTGRHTVHLTTLGTPALDTAAIPISTLRSDPRSKIPTYTSA